MDESQISQKMSKRRKILVRSFAWLICTAALMALGTKIYLISYAELVAQDFKTATSARLKKIGDRARSEVDYARDSGKSAVVKAESLKQLANFYMESQNYAAARDTLLAAERDVATERDDAEHTYLRIQLKRQAALCMADCALYEVSEPILRQAGRLVDHLQRQDAQRSILARAELFNDQGILFYLWANSIKELPRRKMLFGQAQESFIQSARLIGRVDKQSTDSQVVHLRHALRRNLGLVRQDLAFEPR